MWTVTGNIYKKFGWKRIITVERVAFWESFCFRNIASALNEPHMTLNSTNSNLKVFHACFCWYPQIPNCSPFRSMMACFSYDYFLYIYPNLMVNLKYLKKKIFENCKLKISKSQTMFLWGPILRKKIHERFGIIWKHFDREVHCTCSILKFSLPYRVPY